MFNSLENHVKLEYQEVKQLYDYFISNPCWCSTIPSQQFQAYPHHGCFIIVPYNYIFIIVISCVLTFLDQHTKYLFEIHLEYLDCYDLENKDLVKFDFSFYLQIFLGLFSSRSHRIHNDLKVIFQFLFYFSKKSPVLSAILST